MTSTGSGPTPASSPSSSEREAFARGLETMRGRLGLAPLPGATRKDRAEALAAGLVSLRRAVEASVLA